MSIPFNAHEVFEMAKEIEVNGAKFYRASAKKFPQVSKLLLNLAAMEDEHKKTFEEMQAELSGPEVDPPVFDPDGEAEMYLHVMADNHVFDLKANPLDLLEKHKTLRDVLLVAIGMEKDSIAFYVGLKESVSRRAGKDKIDDIIKQEYSHIRTLSEKLHEL
jgi:rubrerythrin